MPQEIGSSGDNGFLLNAPLVVSLMVTSTEERKIGRKILFKNSVEFDRVGGNQIAASTSRRLAREEVDAQRAGYPLRILVLPSNLPFFCRDCRTLLIS